MPPTTAVNGVHKHDNQNRAKHQRQILEITQEKQQQQQQQALSCKDVLIFCHLATEQTNWNH